MMTIRLRSRFIQLVYICIDVFFVYACIFFACLIRQKSLPFEVTFENIIFGGTNPFRSIFIVWILLVVIFANIHRLYQTRRDIFEGFEVWMVVKSVVFAAVCTIVAVYVLKVEKLPRSVILSGSGLMIVALSLWRIIKRVFVEYLVAHGYNNVNVLIVGAGKVGTALSKEIKKYPGLGLRVVGFLDDFKSDAAGEGNKILGKISDLDCVVQRNFIQQIFITTHHDSQVFLKILEKANDLGVAVKVVPQGFDLTTGNFFRVNIGFIPILEYSNADIGRQQTGKRIFDFFVSLMLLIVFFPVFVILSIGICLESRGLPFYSSRRHGKNGKIFNMYKFRSMCQGADQMMDKMRNQNEADGPIFKIKKDPRITRVGQFLRKYSLDELPQILNVLKGEMSLVGPRPLPIDQIEREDLRQLKRLGVKPGITGLWQIRGRSDISFQRLLRWDIWYIKNWSLWLDFTILFQTIPVVLKGKGAY